MRRGRLSLFAAAALLVSSGCGRKPLVFPRAPVVVISVDTLRADHLPVYGDREVSTPSLDALARDSIVFDNAISHVPLTLPSHVSLFTGLLPFQSGVRDNLGYRLGKGVPTLAAFLSGRGYATGGAVSAVVLDHATGVASGFDFWEDRIESSETGQALGQMQRAGGRTERLLEEWIAREPAGRPLFAFLHLYEPHAPYDPPEPFRSRYASRPYDGEIAAADAIVGRFLGFLKHRAIYDPALLFFLSDHGEGLGDHGEDEHGIFLYREEVRVPLFVKLPGGALAGTRVELPAGLADVFPTVAAVIGGKPPARLPGVSLLDLAQKKVGARAVYSETLYPRYHFGWSDLASLTDERHQYIEAPRPELYDWRGDPGEKKNLAAGLPPAFRSLRARLQGMSRPLQPPGVADPEEIRKLASLGYIGRASPEAGERNLPDPKDRIGTLAALKDANRLASEHREGEAVALLRKFASENPRMLDAWESLARVLRRAGRLREAAEALEKADRLAPGTPQILMGLSEIHLAAGDFERARSLALAAGAVGAAGVDEELSSIALAQGDLALARRRAEAAQAKDPKARGPLLLLARIEARQGNPQAGLTDLDRALELEREAGASPMEGLRATRGDLLAHVGREKEAEEDFRREIHDFPENLDAWSRLALLYAAGGRAADFKALLLEMTRRVPTRRAYETASRVCEIVGDREAARRWRSRGSGLDF